jgi:hypothetical protein
MASESQNNGARRDICYSDMEKGEAIHATSCGCPYGYGTSRLPQLLGDLLADTSEVVSLLCFVPFTPGRFLVFISVEC